MSETIPSTLFDSAYTDRTAPWVIDEPQPAVVELEEAGLIRGAVLDAGCGTGEHTILLTSRGYDVLGIDFSARAVEKARANAAERGVDARFEVADALRLDGPPRYDTVVDSALFHVFGDEDRAAYVQALQRVCRVGAVVHVLALSDAEEGFGPRINDSTIREAFEDGWTLEDLRPSKYRAVVPSEDAARLGLKAGETADMAAWLGTFRRN